MADPEILKENPNKLQNVERDIILTKEKFMEEAKKYNLMSDIFMSVALEDRAACQYVLRILMERDDLVVKEVRTQYRISKITSHDAVLDVLAEDREGNLVNIEIQRRDTVDHAKRTRFYGAMIDSEFLMKGATYRDLPEVYIIYISETDIWKKNLAEYPVKKFFKDTEIEYDDGLHILYLNAEVDDGTEKAGLMKYFKTADPEDMSQGELSKRVRFLKQQKGGAGIMDGAAKELYDLGQKYGREEGREEGRIQSLVTIVCKKIQKGKTPEEIADMLEEDVSSVRLICDIVKKHAPAYDENAIYGDVLQTYRS